MWLFNEIKSKNKKELLEIPEEILVRCYWHLIWDTENIQEEYKIILPIKEDGIEYKIMGELDYNKIPKNAALMKLTKDSHWQRVITTHEEYGLLMRFVKLFNFIGKEGDF